MSWKRGTFLMHGHPDGDRVERDCWVSDRHPGLCINHNAAGAAVSHVLSGKFLVVGLTDPATVADRLASLGDWTRSAADIRADDAMRSAGHRVLLTSLADFVSPDQYRLLVTIAEGAA